MKWTLLKLILTKKEAKFPSLITEKESLLNARGWKGLNSSFRSFQLWWWGKKVSGGRNGFGAKLANIYSTEFILETVSMGKKYRQPFGNNMTVIEQPIITTCSKNTGDYTCVIFRPDFQKFKMTRFDYDIISLLKKRVYDLAGCVKEVQVFLNNERLNVNNFKDYMKLYVSDREDLQSSLVYDKCGDRWEIGALPSTESQFQHVSFFLLILH